MELSPSNELLSSKLLTCDTKKDAELLEVFFLQSSRKSKMDYGILSQKFDILSYKQKNTPNNIFTKLNFPSV